MNFDLVIFDCDGTLVDTEELNNRATLELLHDQGLTQYDMDHALTQFVGIRFNQILKNIEAETGHEFPDDMSARYVARVKDLIEDGQYFNTIEGAQELIENCGEHTRICVASNGQRDNVIRSLTAAGLIGFFSEEQIFTGIEVENPKPAPDLFLLAANKMASEPSKTLVIEDSVAGVTAGVSADMKVFGFTGTNHDKKGAEKALKSAGAAHVFTRLIHIQDHLQS